jgi:5-methyltetrahydrofolate--homocysteine methyltransferase
LAEAPCGGAVLVAKGNCGVPEYVDGRIRYSGTPEVMAEYARMAKAAGARIVGGCCGSTTEHVAAMARALREPTCEAPTLTEVEARLGLARAAPASGERAAPRRRRRGESRAP